MLDHAHYITRKVEALFDPTPAERRAIAALPADIRSFRKGAAIIQENDITHSCFVVLEGVTSMVKITGAGDRQIVIVHLMGDMPDLHSLHMPRADSMIMALKPCTLSFTPHKAILALGDKFPRIKDALWRATLVDAAILREWLLNTGQRVARMRVAHFLCEMVVRMKLTDARRAGTIPLTQEEIGDCVGLGPVHVNRSIQSLRRAGLIKWRGGSFEVPSWPALREAADFDLGYLHLTKRQMQILKEAE